MTNRSVDMRNHWRPDRSSFERCLRDQLIWSWRTAWSARDTDPTPAMAEAVRLAATQEGLILDTVYTGKAMAGLIAGVRAGRYQSSDVVIFLHTGGTAGLFAYSDGFRVRSDA